MATVDYTALLGAGAWAIFGSRQLTLAMEEYYGYGSSPRIRGEVDLVAPPGPGNNTANYARLKNKLGLEEAGVLNRQGQLTQRAIQTAEQMQLKEPLKNPAVIAELTRDGSAITDWGKFRTLSTLARNGQRVQVHFYKNLKTGDVNLNIDFKVSDVTYLGDVNLNP